MNAEDTLEIQALMARFSNSFDVKDWDGLRSCLADSVDTDYSDLRGTPPTTVSSADYVRSRQSSLHDVVTHHLSGNYEIRFDDKERATCTVSMIIWRKSGEGQFTTHCVYTFRARKIEPDWKITSITQSILWNEGNPAVYQATGPK